MVQTIIQIGNSEGLTLSKKVREKTGLYKGVECDVEVVNNNTVLVSRVGGKKTVTSITPEFVKVVNGVNKRYGPALKKLAKL